MRVLLDLNVPEFQKRWFSLEKEDRIAVLNTLAQLSAMDWESVFRDKGLHWELIKKRSAPDGSGRYSIRISRKFRAAVWRRGHYLTFLTLHPITTPPISSAISPDAEDVTSEP